MKKVLVIEDEHILNEMLAVTLRNAGLEVEQAYSGEEAVRTLEIKKFHLVITDLMMPNGDGFYVIGEMKKREIETPVVVVSAVEDDDTKLDAYSKDIFDYITKPIQPEIVTKKIENILSVFYKEDESIKIVPRDHKVYVDGKDIKLTLKEFEVFNLLYSFPDRVFSKYDLINEVWYENMGMSEKIVEVNILNIRRKLGKYSTRIKTYRSMGYSYEEEK
jgi:DNA-binding response OmpR family regulator